MRDTDWARASSLFVGRRAAWHITACSSQLGQGSSISWMCVTPAAERGEHQSQIVGVSAGAWLYLVRAIT